MADRLPLVFDGTEIERLQSGDGLVDADGHGYADSENAFSAQGFVIQTANTARGIEETAIPTSEVVVDSDIANMVTAESVFGTDNTILRADGTGRGAQTSPVRITDSGQMILTNTDIGASNTVSVLDANDDQGNVSLQFFVGRQAAANVGVGRTAGDSITTGTHNTCVGTNAGSAITTGVQNTFVGNQAGFTGNSSNNTGVGHRACRAVSSGQGNMAVGAFSLVVLTTGSNNMAVGHASGNTLVGGNNNAFIGAGAGQKIVSGSGNTFLGRFSGSNASQTDVSNSTGIGFNTYTTGDGAVAIGVGVTAAANEIRIGDATHTKVFFPGILNVTSDPVSTGQFWVQDGFVRISDGSIAPQVFDGFVEGPDGATDNALCVWDGATGKLAKDSTVDVDDVVTAASAFGTDNVVLRADGTGKGSQLSALSIDDDGRLLLPSFTDSTRGAAGTAGRVIFNSDDGNLNIDDGTNWILPDGTTT